MVGRAGGDSSESHDTDHLADEEPLDELDSPPLVSIQFETVYYSVLCIEKIIFNLNYVTPLPTKTRQTSNCSIGLSKILFCTHNC